jgi:exopolysaccharide biosynthesis polyprenyl glycosylphosphotransferase
MSRSPINKAASAVDPICILLALILSWAIAPGAEREPAQILKQIFWLWLLFTGIWLLIAARLGVNAIAPSRSLPLALRRTTEAWAATWGISGLIAVTLLEPISWNIWATLILGASALSIAKYAQSYSTALGNGERLRALVIGACPSARALSSTPEVAESVDLLGFIPFTHEAAQSMPHLTKLGAIHDLPDRIRDNSIDIAYVSPSDDAITGEVHQAITECESQGLQTQYFPSFLDVEDLRVGMTWSAQRPGLNVQIINEKSTSLAVKRVIDIIGAAAGILALLPVLATCALAVKSSSRGPVLYRQTRIGKSGQSFKCLKFRTMRVGSHSQQELLRAQSLQDGPAFKVQNDPRVTRIGQFLRKFSIDELPQLFNVLLGQMSLVGPRPPIPTEVDNYTWWQRRRIAIKPGLTCIWQVYGRNKVSFKRWVEMDLYYIDNWSLWLDIKLIARTFGVVLRGTGM